MNTPSNHKSFWGERYFCIFWFSYGWKYNVISKMTVQFICMNEIAEKSLFISENSNNDWRTTNYKAIERMLIFCTIHRNRSCLHVTQQKANRLQLSHMIGFNDKHADIILCASILEVHCFSMKTRKIGATSWFCQMNLN